ncbi:MAG: bifunctional transaldolase/phosoglucose isomerase, partial [Anaerolineales bacterium]
PGTRLEETAHRRGFLAVIPGPPEVGGRYSALSVFGLAPAVLLGADAGALVRGARRMAEACRADPPDQNPGLFLGSLLAAAAEAGRDKITVMADPPMAAFGLWAEQLIAESSGKEGKGLVPIVDEPPAADGSYGPDRLIVYLHAGGGLDGSVKNWVKNGTPVAVIECAEGETGLGAEFFRWEVAVAVACHFLGVNAFNQPDVQGAKDRAAALVKTLRQGKSLRLPPRLWKSRHAELFGPGTAPKPAAGSSLEEIGRWIRAQVRLGEVLAVLVYADPTPALDKALRRARASVRDRRELTMVSSWGPRYLHSTGQLYKGGPDRFVSLVVSADPDADLEIPGWGIGFGQLQRAQAVGDLEALLGRGRRAYGLHFRSRARLVEFARALGG